LITTDALETYERTSDLPAMWVDPFMSVYAHGKRVNCTKPRTGVDVSDNAFIIVHLTYYCA
jgi:hypothetical protein